MTLGYGKVLLAAMVLYGVGTAALAANIQGMRFQDWGGNCSAQVCYLLQVLSKNDQPYMTTAIGYAPGNPYPTVIFELPADANVKEGVKLSVDNKPEITFIGECEETLCRAGFALEPTMMRQFKKGQQALVTFTRGKDKQQESLPLSLMGVTKGLNMLK